MKYISSMTDICFRRSRFLVVANQPIKGKINTRIINLQLIENAAKCKRKGTWNVIVSY